MPWWGCLLVPTAGGAAAGLVLIFGQRLTRAQSSTDYMEAIVIGSGKVPTRASLIKSAAALFSIGSGGSIGREGPMVQLAAVVASRLGRWRNFTPPKLRLLVACGAAAGIASAYNAPIAGSFFVAEIILGTIAMEILSSQVFPPSRDATVHMLTAANVPHRVPPGTFGEVSPWRWALHLSLIQHGRARAECFSYAKHAEKFFVSLKLPIVARSGRSRTCCRSRSRSTSPKCAERLHVVVQMVTGKMMWTGGLASSPEVDRDDASFGSGAPGACSRRRCSWARARDCFSARRCIITAGGRGRRGRSRWTGWGLYVAASHARFRGDHDLRMEMSYYIILPLLLCA